jgi:uncharacterized protein YdaU (DUF1376 family)
MSTHPYLPLYVDDYEAATAHLSAAEDGVYSRLLRLCWRTPGCSLPNDDAWIARKIRLTAAEFAKVAKPVIEEFFTVQRGRITQKRLKAEYENISRKKSARVNAGKMGGAAKALKTKETVSSNATVLPAHTRAFPEPYPEPLEAKASLSSVPPSAAPMTYPEPFEAAWKAYPHVKGRSSKPKALGYWRRLSPAIREALPSAVARYARDGREPKADCGAPAMQRWLSEARFSDWMPDAESSSAGGWSDERWAAVVALNREEGWWTADLGPPPGQPGCQVPAHLIERKAA